MEEKSDKDAWDEQVGPMEESPDFSRDTFEGSDAGASEESFASMQEEEGTDSDFELLEEPPLGAQFRY